MERSHYPVGAGRKILIVTAKASAQRTLFERLSHEGLAVAFTTDASDALAQVKRHECALLAVDVSIGAALAEALCAQVRSVSTSPLIVFGGYGSDPDPVRYLERGADDYIPRPDRPHELVARMRGLLRRASATTPEREQSSIEVGEVRLDRGRHEVMVRGAPVGLTRRQFELLELFLTHPNQVLPRGLILDRVWGADSASLANRLEVQVARLRQRLRPPSGERSPIRTVRGVGYMYSTD